MSYKAHEIIRIMREAQKLGVESLSLGEIDISFSNRSIPQESSISQKAKVPEKPLENPIVETQQAIIDEQAKILEEYRRTEEDYLNLPVLDPVAWEMSQARIAEESDSSQGEIVDAKPDIQ